MNQFRNIANLPECQRKESMINKYTHLFAFLKKKYQKN